MNDRVKKRLFIFIMAVLLLPVVQGSFHLFSDIRLYGYSTMALDVDFTSKEWWSGRY